MAHGFTLLVCWASDEAAAYIAALRKYANAGAAPPPRRRRGGGEALTEGPDSGETGGRRGGRIHTLE